MQKCKFLCTDPSPCVKTGEFLGQHGSKSQEVSNVGLYLSVATY